MRTRCPGVPARPLAAYFAIAVFTVISRVWLPEYGTAAASVVGASVVVASVTQRTNQQSTAARVDNNRASQYQPCESIPTVRVNTNRASRYQPCESIPTVRVDTNRASQYQPCESIPTCLLLCESIPTHQPLLCRSVVGALRRMTLTRTGPIFFYYYLFFIFNRKIY